jgi:GNAT superfamily N-acetyltransferase
VSPAILARAIPLAQTRELRQAVLRPHETIEQLAADEAPDTFAVGAFDDGELVAVGLIAPDGEPDAWRVRGMATAPRARRRGGGRAVLDALVLYAVEHGAVRIWCNARVPAVGFYERAGMHVTSGEFELPNIGPHVVMEMRVGADA